MFSMFKHFVIYLLALFVVLTHADTPTIKASGGKDCFKSLDAQDMQNLGSILYLRNKTANSKAPLDYEEQIKAINATFTGDKRDAAFAVLSIQISRVNEARLKQAMNQAVGRGEKKLNQKDLDGISDLLELADKGGKDRNELIASLNLKTAILSPYARLLQSKGATLLPTGEWKFKDFDFAKAKDDPELKEALAAFFPREVQELSSVGRGYTVIGDRVVMNNFDINQKRTKEKAADWFWESADIEEHMKKSLALIDRFTKKAEDFARLSKENGNWINITNAAMSEDMFCGVSYKDILLPTINPLIKVSDYITGGKNGMQKWEAKLDDQMKVRKELNDIIGEMTVLGASDETKAALRQTMFDLENKSADELEGGIDGMKKALTALTFAPLAVIGAPAILPSAGATSFATGMAYLATGMTVVSLATPVVIATRNVHQAVKEGDGLLCSMFKQGAIISISTVDTLKWAAMGPAVKAINPYFQRLSDVLRVGETASKYIRIVPSAIVSGQGIFNATNFTIESHRAIANIEKALAISRQEGKTSQVAVLEEMLQEAKDQKWLNVISLARSSVYLIDNINQALTKSVINNVITTNTSATNPSAPLTSSSGNSVSTNSSAGNAPITLSISVNHVKLKGDHYSSGGASNATQVSVSAPDESFTRAIGSVVSSANSIVIQEETKVEKTEKVEEVKKTIEKLEEPVGTEVPIDKPPIQKADEAPVTIPGPVITAPVVIPSELSKPPR